MTNDVTVGIKSTYKVASGVTIGWTGWTMSRGPRVPGAPEFQTKKYIFGNTVQI